MCINWGEKPKAAEPSTLLPLQTVEGARPHAHLRPQQGWHTQVNPGCKVAECHAEQGGGA